MDLDVIIVFDPSIAPPSSFSYSLLRAWSGVNLQKVLQQSNKYSMLRVYNETDKKVPYSSIKGLYIVFGYGPSFTISQIY